MNRRDRRINAKLDRNMVKRGNLIVPEKYQKVPTIAIGRLAKDFVYARFDHCFGQLCAVSAPHFNLAGLKQDSPLPHFGRDMMVDSARAIEADYLFFIDSDEVFPPDVLVNLYEHQKDIVVANYPKRIEPYQCVNPDPIEAVGALYKLPWAATGCMLIKMDVFNKIDWPYFDTIQKLDENGKKIRIGEDQYFTIKARVAGIDIWCDHTIEIGHTAMEDKFL